MESNFNYKFNQNNNPDIGRLIDESFATFKKTIWVMGIGMLFLAILGIVIFIIILGLSFGFSSFEEFVQNSPSLQHDTTYLIINAAIGIFLAGLMAPITAGFYKINHLAASNKEFGFNTLFDYYSSKHLKDLVIYGVLVAIITNIISLGFTYLNYPIIAVIFQVILAFLFIFGVPLIIFENQNATEAMTNSSRMALRHPFSVILSSLFAFLIAALGFFAICIGILFTAGYIYTMIYGLYDSIIPVNNTNPLDEIGLE